jgi:hypothetical protein
MANARLYVDPPPFQSTPFGLLSVMQFRDNTDPHWQAGITYEPLCASASTIFDTCMVTGTGGPGPTKTATTTRVTRGALPFTVFEEVDCGPIHWTDAEAFAQQALLNSESYQLERVFWTGLAGPVGNQAVINPHLAANAILYDQSGPTNSILLQPAAAPVTGTAVDPVEGLGLIEKALGDAYNGVGIIHMPVNVIPHFSMSRLLVDGPRLKTWNGNLVAAGTGYPGTGPDGTLPPAGQTWIYATGPVFGYRGQVRVLPIGVNNAARNQQTGFDRNVDTVKAIAERTYVVGWDCALIAVLLDTGGEVVGAPLSSH